MLAQVSYSRDGAMRRETGAFAGQPSALTSTVHVGRSQPPCNGLSSRGATPSCARAVEAYGVLLQGDLRHTTRSHCPL